MRNFIVVGKNRGLVLQVLLAIHGFTDATCVVVGTEEASSLLFSNLCALFLEMSLYGEADDKFVDTVNDLAGSMPGLVLLCADCEGARMTWRVRDRLKVIIAPAPEPFMLDCLDNKWKFYQFCIRHGLNAPLTRFVGSKCDLEFAATALELGTPFVIKPVNEASGKGARVIFDEKDYRREILDDRTYQYAPLIAQKYVPGTEVGLDLFSIRGRVAAMAIQQRHYPQHMGAKITFVHNSYLESVAHTLCMKIGYEGVMNIDARVEEATGAVFLIDCNPRYWRSLLASAWCGLNFVAENVSSPPQPGSVHMLTSGSADTFYHPLFRPSLWHYALFDHVSHRGRIARCMMFDVCTLGASVKSVLTGSDTHAPPAALSRLFPAGVAGQVGLLHRLAFRK